MRLLSFVAVACVFALSTASSVIAEPITVIEEHWATWRDTDPGRTHDEPLNFANHLAGPTSEAGLNATDPNEEFVSASGYVFTGIYGTGAWAFTLKSPEANYLDFTQGTDDLTFDVRNSSASASFRILLADSAGDYYASDETFTSVSTTTFNTVACDFDGLTWKSFDTDTLSMGTTSVTPNLGSVTEVGFATLVNSNAMRIDNIVAEAVPVPEPHTVSLLLVAVLGVILRSGIARF